MSGNSLSIGSLHCLKWTDDKGQQQTFSLVEQVSSKWREIGLAIGITNNTLCAWEDQYRGNADLCWTRVMDHLLKGECEDFPASWDGICSLLDDCQLSSVSKSLKEVVNKLERSSASPSTGNEATESSTCDAPFGEASVTASIVSANEVEVAKLEARLLESIEDLKKVTLAIHIYKLI